MEQMLGFEPGEMNGRHLFSFMDEKNVELAKSKIERRKNGISEEHPFEFIRKDGTKILATLKTSPLIGADGKYRGALAAVNNITEQINAEHEKAKIQAQLFHSSKLAAKCYIHLARDQFQKHDKSFGIILEKQEKAVERIVSIVNALRAFARVDNDNPELLDVNITILETLGLCEKIYLKDSVTITHKLQKPLPVVRCNPGKLQQVVTNLLSNAKDACHGLTDGGISIETSQEQNHVFLKIRDNGSGMSPELTQKIFDPFFTTKPQGKGTGLGLSISYSIIKEAGGTIDVESAPGAGSTFTIKLPAAAAGRP